MKEEWRDIVGYEGMYQVSDSGNVRSLDRIVINNVGVERLLKGTVLKQYNTFGYLSVSLNKDGVAKRFRTHRLVAEAFIANIENKPTVNHKDGDKANNHVNNLEWFTNKEQTKHMHEMGLKKNKYRYGEINDEIIQSYTSGTSVSELSKIYNIHPKTISDALKRSGVEVKTSRQLNVKPVICKNQKGEVIKEFETVGEASRWLCEQTNSHYKMHKGIRRCCEGETKQCKGYVWEYKCERV